MHIYKDNAKYTKMIATMEQGYDEWYVGFLSPGDHFKNACKLFHLKALHHLKTYKSRAFPETLVK